ncbi:MAG: Hpt domain-containing protein [Oscillospiraceae bacterium]
MNLEESGIDLETGLERFGDNEELFIKLLRKFPGDLSYQTLIQALREEDYQEAFKAAHTLKGVAANLSLTSLCGILNPYVEALRNLQIERATELFEQVKDTYQKTIQAINSLEEEKWK